MVMGNHWYEDTKGIKAVVIIIILVLVPIILILIPLGSIESGPTLCVYKNITGRDCWGCGMTRAVVSGLKLEFRAAYNFNKRVVVVFPLLVYLWFKWMVQNIRTLIRRRTTKALSCS